MNSNSLTNDSPYWFSVIAQRMEVMVLIRLQYQILQDEVPLVSVPNSYWVLWVGIPRYVIGEYLFPFVYVCLKFAAH